MHVALSIQEALAVPVLRRANPQVLAGGQQLHRPIRWVHVVEQTEIAHLLKGGELLLTTGLRLATGTGVRRRFLQQLQDSDAAGLVIELGRTFTEVPTDLVRAATEAGLPLVALTRETPFVEVTEQVHRAIIARQHEVLDRVEALNREFSNLVLGGADIPALLQHLSRAVGNPVVLEDRAHQIVGLAGPDDTTATADQPITTDWQRHSRSHHQEAEPGDVHQESGPPPCLWAGIWLRHEPWGRVHILQTNQRFDDLTRLLLDRAGVTLSLALLARADEEQIADRAAGSLVAALASGHPPPGGDVLTRARALGTDLGTGDLVALIVDVVDLPDVTARRALDERQVQRLRLRLRGQLQDSLTKHGCAALSATDGDRILTLVSLPRTASPSDTLETLATTIRRDLATIDSALTVVMGASRSARPEALPHAFEEARTAIEFGRHSGQRDLYQFGDLGTYPLLRRLAQGPELAAYVESQLGPLLEHDSRSQYPLLPTLQAFLTHAGRKADAVRDLHIQRRTLYARLTRIERLTGRDLDDQGARTQLSLALQGLSLLRAPGRGSE